MQSLNPNLLLSLLFCHGAMERKVLKLISVARRLSLRRLTLRRRCRRRAARRVAIIYDARHGYNDGQL